LTTSDANPDPQRDFAEVVVRTLRDAGFTALWAGGCVRDLLLNRTPKDYDVATDARPEQVREVFGHRRTLAVGESFGVIVVLGPKRSAGQVEVATFRNDGQYVDGRRPESVEFSSPEEDAHRRDFTINGMFYDPIERQVLDFVGGQEDLKRGVIRAIGTALHRMQEDKLRLLRAVRFASTFEFELEEQTANAAREMAGEISVVSAERIAQELRRMLGHPNRAIALELCRDINLLPHILPELDSVSVNGGSTWQQLLETFRQLKSATFPLVFGAAFSAVVDEAGVTQKVASQCVLEAGKRLRLSNDEIDHAEWLVRYRHSLDEAPGLSLARLKRILAQPLAEDLLLMVEARLRASNSSLEAVEFCRTFLRETPADEINPPPLLTGAELIAAGLKPGPRFKQLLDSVRDAQLNLQIATPEDAIRLAETMIGEK
jgi:poly(A) polymerase